MQSFMGNTVSGSANLEPYQILGLIDAEPALDSLHTHARVFNNMAMAPPMSIHTDGDSEFDVSHPVAVIDEA
jgi:hypothetical protein